MHIPTSEDWKSLQQQVQEYGLYHAYRLAIAPTQSISYVQNATSSVMPIVIKLNDVRMEMLKHFIQCLSYHLKQCGTINQHLIRSNETYRFNFNNSNTCGPRDFNNFIC